MSARDEEGVDVSGSEESSGRSLVARVLRDPVAYFLGLAVVLFALAEGVERIRKDVIEIDPLEVEARIRQMERATGTPLTEEERRLAELALVDEVILARAAAARGLDDDARIRAILSQKMLHLMSMDLRQPTDAELRAFFEENEARYATPPSLTVDQLLAPRGSPPPSAGDPRALLHTDGYEHTVLSGVTLNELSIAFGVETAGRIVGAEDGAWIGPHLTERGSLWFRVVERLDAGPPPPFESIVGQVRFDWMTEHEEPYLRERVAELRQRYRVRVLDGSPEGR